MDESDSRLRIAVVFGMALLAILLLLTAIGFDPDLPLPWDMSHHYLGALQIRDAVRDFSLPELGRALFEPDLYPPGHSLILGSWLLIAGESGLSVFLFRCLILWVFVLALAWAAVPLTGRDSWKTVIFGCILLGICMRFMALAGTFLVDAPAAVLAFLSLVLIARLAHRPSGRLFAGALALSTLTLLTKYNVGLPLIPAAGAVAAAKWLGRERRTALKVLAVGILALSMWALFLTIQVNGWVEFSRFAANRANSLGWSTGARAHWYLNTFLHGFFAAPWFGWVCLALAGVAIIVIRGPLILASITYLATTLLALSRHPYLLDRNLVAAAVVCVALAALGGVHLGRWIAHSLPRRAQASLAFLLVAAAAFTLLSSVPSTLVSNQREYGPDAERLKPISRFISTEMRKHQECCVLGTFNAFSPGWVRILARRIPARRRPHLRIGFPYPLKSSRTGLDARPDPSYVQTIREWERRDKPKFVVNIDVRDGSVFDDDDYARWNAWKRNYIQVIRNSPDARLMSSTEADSQRVVAEAISLGNPSIEYGPGWGDEEAWGRWAEEKVAALRILSLSNELPSGGGGGGLRWSQRQANLQGHVQPGADRVLRDFRESVAMANPQIHAPGLNRSEGSRTQFPLRRLVLRQRERFHAARPAIQDAPGFAPPPHTASSSSSGVNLTSSRRAAIKRRRGKSADATPPRSRR